MEKHRGALGTGVCRQTFIFSTETEQVSGVHTHHHGCEQATSLFVEALKVKYVSCRPCHNKLKKQQARRQQAKRHPSAQFWLDPFQFPNYLFTKGKRNFTTELPPTLLECVQTCCTSWPDYPQHTTCRRRLQLDNHTY